MTRWLMLLVAVLANVVTNIALKKFAVGGLGNPPGLLTTIMNPWLALAVLAGLALVGSYVFAIERIDLEVAYAVVTTGSLVVLAGSSPVLLGTGYSPMRLVGVAFAVAGIGLIVYSQVTAN